MMVHTFLCPERKNASYNPAQAERLPLYYSKSCEWYDRKDAVIEQKNLSQQRLPKAGHLINM